MLQLISMQISFLIVSRISFFSCCPSAYVSPGCPSRPGIPSLPSLPGGPGMQGAVLMAGQVSPASALRHRAVKKMIAKFNFTKIGAIFSGKCTIVQQLVSPLRRFLERVAFYWSFCWGIQTYCAAGQLAIPYMSSFKTTIPLMCYYSDIQGIQSEADAYFYKLTVNLYLHCTIVHICEQLCTYVCTYLCI